MPLNPNTFGAVVAAAATSPRVRAHGNQLIRICQADSSPARVDGGWSVGGGLSRPKMRCVPLPTKPSADCCCVLNCCDRVGSSRCIAEHVEMPRRCSPAHRVTGAD